MDLVRRRRNETGIAPRDMMEDFVDRFFQGWGLPTERTYLPPLDVAENNDEVIIKADLPGIKTEDLDLSVQGNTLFISGEKKEEAEQKETGFYHVERRYGTFRREVTLPTAVDADRIEAGYRDGVLTIRLPKSAAAKPRKIKVETEATK